MSFFLTCLKSGLRARLFRWQTWAVPLLLPLITFGTAHFLPAQEAAAPVQVGVVLPEEGGDAFWRRLEARSGLAVTFHAAEPDQAERQVAAGRWDCALVLPEDFEARLDGLDTTGLFTLLVGPGSAVYPLTRETITACVAECIAPGMAERYLLDSGIADSEDLSDIRPRLREVLLDQERVLVTLETAGGGALDPLALADSGISNLLAGLTAVLLLVWALLAAMDLGRWLETPFARRLIPLRGRLALLLPRLAGALIPALCAGALALLAVDRPLPCILALVPYLLFWGAAALALAQCRPLWSALPALLPFIPTAGLLLSPVLLDLSLLIPPLAPVIRWMPITLYLRACGGSWGDAAALAAGGGAVFAILLTVEAHKEGGR